MTRRWYFAFNYRTSGNEDASTRPANLTSWKDNPPTNWWPLISLNVTERVRMYMYTYLYNIHFPAPVKAIHKISYLNSYQPIRTFQSSNRQMVCAEWNNWRVNLRASDFRAFLPARHQIFCPSQRQEKRAGILAQIFRIGQSQDQRPTARRFRVVKGARECRRDRKYLISRRRREDADCARHVISRDIKRIARTDGGQSARTYIILVAICFWSTVFPRRIAYPRSLQRSGFADYRRPRDKQQKSRRYPMQSVKNRARRKIARF